MSPMNNRRMTPMAEPGVLDFAPGAAAAYSLRSLSNSYVGPVVTVRRSTDNAEADFTASEVSDGTLAAWCMGGDGFVKVWHDQSQNGRDATQTTTANQPRIVNAGSLETEGGKPALFFDGNKDQLAFSTLSLGTDYYIATLSYLTASVPIACILLGHSTAGNLNWDNGSGGRLYHNASNSTADVVGGWPKGENVIISIERSGLSLTARTNGAAAARTMSSNNALSLSIIGERTDLAAYDYSWDGKIQEILIYDTAPHSIERIEANMAWYF